MNILTSDLSRRSEDRAAQVLLISPNAFLREQLRSRLGPLNWHTYDAVSGSTALELLRSQPGIEIVLLDAALPDLLLTEFMGLVRHSFPLVEILTVDAGEGHVLVGSASPTSFASKVADLLYKNGMSVLKPVAKAPDYPRTRADAPGIRGMVGDSPVMQKVYDLIHMVAPRDTTVLITGESGTGKDLVAQAIHAISPRQKFPFVVVNCAAIPESLLESELFGHAKGAFTGAMQSRIGRIHAAHGGTLFLDEIGDMPLTLQSKILRFIEQGEVQRLGSNDNLRVDVRVVAATNAPLLTMIKENRFREDLYYRLAVFPIRLAPLRERGDDVSCLTESFVRKFCPNASFDEQAMEIMTKHPWPGNVRELRNVIERASILAGKNTTITAEHILL